MLGKIVAINESLVSVKLDIDIYSVDGLIGKHAVFRDKSFTNIGEIITIEDGIMKTILTGEIKDGTFLFGDITVFLVQLQYPCLVDSKYVYRLLYINLVCLKTVLIENLEVISLLNLSILGEEGKYVPKSVHLVVFQCFLVLLFDHSGHFIYCLFV